MIDEMRHVQVLERLIAAALRGWHVAFQVVKAVLAAMLE